MADDIALTHFREPVNFSSNGRLFLVLTERGRLDLNRSQSSIRVYQSSAIDRFVLHPEGRKTASALWTITKSSYKNGPVISDVRWLAASTEIVFVAKTARGNNQLFLGNVQTRVNRALTPENQNVTAFDVRSAQRFVYTVYSPAIRRHMRATNEAVEVNGTGQSLSSLIFPDETLDADQSNFDLSELWAVVDGRRFRVSDSASNRPIPIHLEGQRTLALSPNGRSVVTALTVKNIPPDWELHYKPASASFPYQVRAGDQNPYGFDGQHDVSEYVMIDLFTREIKPLTSAPLGDTAGWVGISHADWSADGKSVVLSDTFLSPEVRSMSTPTSRPCVAVIDIPSGRGGCVDYLQQERAQPDDEEGWRVYDVHFASGEKNSVIVRYAAHGDVVYVQSAVGSWSSAIQIAVPRNHKIDVTLEQDMNRPPVLVARDSRTRKSRIIWDPNPELQHIALGNVSTFKWKDKTWRDWVGGLYKPPDYISGRRYPLVIQTHGFDETSFLPSGAFPTAFAAQELAASGFVVLQVEDCPIRDSPEEGPCQMAGYEAAISGLAALGLIDPDRVGIIGFSRTCYYVLNLLSSSSFRFRAASITDGINAGYLQYVTSVDTGGDGLVHEYDAMIGTHPFGRGLRDWLERSPEFNMNKIDTPLQIVALGRPSTLFMWEPYADLRLLDKPVELIMINTNEHILSNPAARAISQGRTVDWFRFWLQGYEDPDPVKAPQYKFWEALRSKQQTEKQ